MTRQQQLSGSYQRYPRKIPWIDSCVVFVAKFADASSPGTSSTCLETRATQHLINEMNMHTSSARPNSWKVAGTFKTKIAERICGQGNTRTPAYRCQSCPRHTHAVGNRFSRTVYRLAAGGGCGLALALSSAARLCTALHFRRPCRKVHKKQNKD